MIHNLYAAIYENMSQLPDFSNFPYQNAQDKKKVELLLAMYHYSSDEKNAALYNPDRASEILNDLHALKKDKNHIGTFDLPRLKSLDVVDDDGNELIATLEEEEATESELKYKLLEAMLQYSSDANNQLHDPSRAAAITKDLKSIKANKDHIKSIGWDRMQQYGIVGEDRTPLIQTLDTRQESDNDKDNGFGQLSDEELPDMTDDDSGSDASEFDSEEEYESDDEEAWIEGSPDGGRRYGEVPTTVGWKNQGRGKKVINGFGAPNRMWYRLQGTAVEGYEFPDHENFALDDNRCGWMRANNGPMFTEHDIRGVWGIAFDVIDAESFEDEPELINPTTVHRMPPTYVLIKWAGVGKRWETRGTLRDRWGKKRADIELYRAARKAMERYLEGARDPTKRADRSPSVPLIRATVEKQSRRSLEPSTPSPKARFSRTPGMSSSTSTKSRRTRISPPDISTPSPTNKASGRKKSQKKQVAGAEPLIAGSDKAEFLQNMSELYDVKSFNELNQDERLKVLDDYKLFKAQRARKT